MDENTQTMAMDAVERATQIVSAYIANNSLPAADLPVLIGSVHAALIDLSRPLAAESSPAGRVMPAQIRKSITPDHLVSFEDGKPYKTLRRHLTLRGLTPDAYRAKWGLPRDYPMTASNYSAQRSQLARSLGLGLRRRKAELPATMPAELPQDPAIKARRRRKTTDGGPALG